MKNVKKPNKFVDSIKQGFLDIKVVLEEGNYKLFLKPLVLIIALVFGYRYVNDMFQKQDRDIASKIEAVYTQQNSEQEYMTNKQKLLELEPRFPDLESKNDWLLRQIVAIFKNSSIRPSMGNSQSENTSNNGYTVVSLPVDIEASYKDFALLLADIENRDEFLRVSQFSIDKKEGTLGTNAIKMQFNTIFPKEKIAQSIFRDNIVTTGNSTSTSDTSKRSKKKH